MESFSSEDDSSSLRETFFMRDRLRDKNDFTTAYDYCLVLPVDPVGSVTKSGRKVEGFTAQGLECVRHLNSVGVDYLAFYGTARKLIFVLMRASLQQLRSYAEYTEYDLPLNSEKLRVTVEEGDLENDIQPMHIAHIAKETTLYPYQHIFGPYRSDIPEEIYATRNSMSHPFCAPVRLRLTQSMIETISIAERHTHAMVDRDSLKPKERETEMKNLREQLLRKRTRSKIEFNAFGNEETTDNMLTFRQHLLLGNMLAFFPLHNSRELDMLRGCCEKWTIMPWQLPTNKISHYFGEKIALYFDFIGHYAKWLLVPALFGIPIQIMMLHKDSFSTKGQVVYAAFILIWGIVMLEAWKRKEARIALKRGMSQYNVHEADRPEFKGVIATSHIDGEVIMYYPSSYRRRKIILSFTLIGAMILLVIGTIIAIYIMRAALSDPLGSWAQVIASIASSAQIQILNRIYPTVADKLTEFENHRTDTDFSDSMTTKLFVFFFVNSYGTFFYIAFIASQSGDEVCGGATCMPALALNLAIIFGIRETAAIMNEAVIPWLKWQRKLDSLKASESEGVKRHELSRAELQFVSPIYDVMKESIEEYAEIAIQFGYLMLFAAALPIAPLVGLLASCVEAKADLFKFLHIYQRPTIRSTENIGAWQDILAIVSSLSVITNAGIVVFTMNIFDDRSDFTRFWIFILFQWILVGFQLATEVLIPDVPSEVIIQQARQKVLVERAVFKIPGFTGGGHNSNLRSQTSAEKKYTIFDAEEQDGRISIAHEDEQEVQMKHADDANDDGEDRAGILDYTLSSEEQASRFGSIPQHSLHKKLERSQAVRFERQESSGRGGVLVKRQQHAADQGHEAPRASMGLQRMHAVHKLT